MSEPNQMSDVDSALVASFVVESQEHLAEIESQLLAIEQQAPAIDSDLVNKVFRAVHSIKGASGFLGLTTIGKLSHSLENVLNLTRNRELTPTSEIIEVLLHAADALRGLINDVEHSGAVDVADHISALKQIVDGGTTAAVRSSVHQNVPVSVPDGHVLQVSEYMLTTQRSRGRRLYVIEFDLIADVEEKGKTPITLIKELIAFGELLDSAVCSEDWGQLEDGLPSSMRFVALIATVLEDVDMVAAAFDTLPSRVHRVEVPTAAPATDDDIPRTGATGRPATRPAAPASVTTWPMPGTGLSPELVSDFVAESADHIHELESALLEFEKAPENLDYINSVFRSIHSIKGTADYVGLAQIKTLSHRFENVLDLARKGQLGVTSGVSDLIFGTADALKSMINSLAPDAEKDADFSQLVLRLDQVVEGAAPDRRSAPAVSPAVAADPQLAIFVQSASQQIENIRACRQKVGAKDTSEPVVSALHRALTSLITAADYMGRNEFLAPADQILDIVELFKEGRLQFDELMLEIMDEQTSELAQSLERARGEAAPRGGTPRLGEILCRQGAAAPEEIESALNAPMRVGDKIVAQGLVTREQVEAAAASQSGKAPAPKVAAVKTMRIDQDKLDSYLNLAGELLVARNGLVHAFGTVQNGKSSFRQLKDAIDGVGRIATDIQDNAMAMRMVPVKDVFQRFPRMIRDIAKAQGKQINIEVFGEETELDKQVAQALGDPLVHLVRNSADHGIELPEERRAAGKSETGLVALRAARAGNLILIDVVDDGAGIDVERLKAKAADSGIITRERAATMPREEALQLIFAPGLSTAKVVSDISGRGVGMDVVRNNITGLGGSVVVTSEEGRGSQMRIRLPLTLAVTTVVVIGCAGETYALPMEAVHETVKVSPSDIKHMKGERIISLRGAVLGLKPLANLLSSHSSESHLGNTRAANLTTDHTEQIPIVVVSAGGTRFGLIVDELKGQQGIVVKPLPSYLAQLPGLGGATIMGDGTIVLVLDPARVLDLAIRADARKSAELSESRTGASSACGIAATVQAGV